ncbi:MAG: Smr/MutS family protein [Saprospiraceae bacterium]|nr:Smr/MutS family protein [Saprospiraceae bacterium]
MNSKRVTLLPKSLKEDLGFDKLIQICSQYAVGEEAKNQITKIEISFDTDHINHQLKTTEQLYEIISQQSIFIQPYSQVESELKYLKIENYCLSVEEIVAIRIVLENLLQIRNIVAQKEWSHLDFISRKIVQVPDVVFLVKTIAKIIQNDGTIHDKASDDLFLIRKKIQDRKSDVYRVFKKVLNQLKMAEVLAEGEESIRNGRFVLRVLAEHKRKIDGIVHGESEKGKTIFIEPKELVELNNEILELESEEKKEIYKILTALCQQIRPHTDSIQESYHQLVEWDIFLARAKLTQLLDAKVPGPSENDSIQLVRARHPLLYLKLKDQEKTLVASDIAFDEAHRIIVVSGPNAGGKTILLKTAGLLQCMYQAGLPVTVDKGSRLKVFKKIFADIGDHQSLDDDLSTYSAKLKNMRDFDRLADKDTFILIDELGSGTEPVIGGAIGEAFLDSVNQKKVTGIVNTHFSNLKTFAHREKGLQNAAMIFDDKKLLPTYRLQIGRPGGSFALEIAQKIKLPEHIVHSAKKKAGNQTVQFENLLTKLDQENQNLQKQIEEFKFKKAELDKLIKSYHELQKQNEFKKLKLKLDQKQMELQLSMNKQKEIDKYSKELRKEKDLERLLSKAEAEKNKVEKNTEDILRLSTEILNAQNGGSNHDLKPGDSVKLILTGMLGKISKIEKGKITVDTENMTFKLKRNEIVKVKPIIHVKPERSIKSDVESSGKAFHPVLDLRGMRLLEAEQLLEQFIDKALISNVNKVHIIHGKGSGALKKTVLKTLRHQNYIKQISHPEEDPGGETISIVEFQ